MSEKNSFLNSCLSSPFLVLCLWVCWGGFLWLIINFFLAHRLMREGPAVILFALLFFYLGGLLLIWFFRARRAGWSSVGFSGFALSAFIWGLFAFCLFTLFTAFYGYLLRSLFGCNLYEVYDLSPFFFRIKGFWLLPAFLVIGLLGPLTEELFFRGYIYLYLKEKKGFFPALFISSFVFSLLHFLLLLIPPFLFFVILSALMLEKRNSLDASLIFHILNNVLALIFYLFLRS